MVFETDKGLLGTIPDRFNRKNFAVSRLQKDIILLLQCHIPRAWRSISHLIGDSQIFLG